MMKARAGRWRLAGVPSLALLLLVPACRSYNKQILLAEGKLYSGRPAEGLKTLGEKIREDKDSKERLLYLMEGGMLALHAGKHKRARRLWREADKLGESLVSKSVGQAGLSFLVNDLSKDYPGEDFERVMINTYLGILHLTGGDFDTAAVEFRRVNDRLLSIKRGGERRYKENTFARLTAGLAFLAGKNYDPAAVEFRKVLQADPGNRLAKSLLLLTYWRDGDRRYYRQERDRLGPPLWKQSEMEGRFLVVLYGNGRGPVKVRRGSTPPASAWPMFIPRPGKFKRLDLELKRLKRGARPLARSRTWPQYDLEQTAIKNLNEDYKYIVAKSTTRYVAKRAAGEIAYQKLKDENPMWAALAWIGLRIYADASEQADLRCWHTLPADLQIGIIPLPPGEGKYVLAARARGRARKDLPPREVTVKKNSPPFLFHYLRTFE